MTSSFRILVRRILIVLFAALLPTTAFSQEPSQQPSPPADQKQAAAVKEPAAQAQPVAAAAPAAGQLSSASPSEAGGVYVVKQGDTLWDISAALLRDPFLWPLLWKANPSITNADLIYPGNNLTIPSLAPIERAIASPAAAPAQEQLVEKPAAAPAPAVASRPAEKSDEGGLFGRKLPSRANAAEAEEQEQVSRLLLPESAQLPLVDKYTVLRAGFVSFDNSNDKIIGILLGEKTIYAYNDIVYVNISSKETVPGDKFLIYTPLHPVRHPVTGSRYGNLVRVDGVLEIVAPGTGGTFSARIIMSFDSAAKGSLLTPYQDPPLLFSNPPAKNKDIDGYVLDIKDPHTMTSQLECIYLDKGTADGVELGDRFAIYNKVPKASYPKNKIGEAQVILVKERTATAIINQSVEAIAVGNTIEYKK